MSVRDGRRRIVHVGAGTACGPGSTRGCVLVAAEFPRLASRAHPIHCRGWSVRDVGAGVAGRPARAGSRVGGGVEGPGFAGLAHPVGGGSRFGGDIGPCSALAARRAGRSRVSIVVPGSVPAGGRRACSPGAVLTRGARHANRRARRRAGCGLHRPGSAAPLRQAARLVGAARILSTRTVLANAIDCGRRGIAHERSGLAARPGGAG